MDRPIATASRVDCCGDTALAVTVSLLKDGKYVVSISDPWNGSGVAVGEWPNGFIACDIPSRSEIRYVEKTFGLCVMGQVPRSDFVDWNNMYKDALSEVNGEAAKCRQKKN